VSTLEWSSAKHQEQQLLHCSNYLWDRVFKAKICRWTSKENSGFECWSSLLYYLGIFIWYIGLINMLIIFNYLYILLSLHWCVRFWMLCCFLSSLFCIVYDGQLLFVFHLLFVQFDPCRCELGAAQCLFIVWTYLPWNNNLICIRHWFNIFLFVRPMSDTCQI
jgi:hypothetical protein